MASNSHRKSGSSARSTGRKRVVIGAEETVRVRYKKDRPEVESERRRAPHARERTKPSKARGPGARMASVKRDERERRQRQISRRRGLIWVVLVVIAVGVVWGLIALARAPIFSVDQITVNGVTRLTRAQVLDRAKVPAETTLLRLPKGAIVKRLLAEPWIAEARVVRRFPHTLEIDIAERRPVAIVDAGGTSIWLVDNSATWLAPRSATDTRTLPVIRDVENITPKAGTRSASAELQNAIAVLNGLSSELRSKVRTVTAPTIDKTALILSRGVQIFVGSAEDIAKKDQVAQAILAQNKNVVYVNVRVVDRPTWRGLDTSK
jgi:cell division protein FtsQ